MPKITPINSSSGKKKTTPKKTSARIRDFRKLSDLALGDENTMMLSVYTSPHAAMLEAFVVAFVACLSMSRSLNDRNKVERLINKALKDCEKAGPVSLEFAQGLAIYFRYGKERNLFATHAGDRGEPITEIKVWAHLQGNPATGHILSKKEVEALQVTLIGAVLPEKTDDYSANLDAIEIIEGKEPKWQKQAQRESAGGCVLPAALLMVLIIAIGSVL